MDAGVAEIGNGFPVRLFLGVKSRQKAGLSGGVFHLFYCTAFLIPEGTALLQAAGGEDPPWIDVTPDKLVVTTRDSKDMLYHDVPDDQAEAAVAQLKPHNYQTFHTPLTYAGWRYISATYLYCTQDRAIPIVAQKAMVEEFAKGVDIRTKTLDASHSPFLSMPGPTALAILDAAMTEALVMKWQD